MRRGMFPRRSMKKMFCRFIVMVALLGMLGFTGSGCGQRSSKSVVIMQHPETMEFVNCKVDEWAIPSSYAKNARCVEDLKKQGYIVWGER